MPIQQFSVQSSKEAYEVFCGRGVLSRLPEAVGATAGGGNVFLVSSTRVWRHCGTRIQKILRGKYRATILMDDREAAKNLATVNRACRQLVRAGADRHALLVAIGG
jgi:3-dehydroquinate synthetase